jgi:hypothetical protein
VLGSPLNGSKAASGAARWPMLRPLLGPHVLNELAVAKPRHWTWCQRARFDRGHAAHGYRAVLRALRRGQRRHGRVSETVIPGLADHLALPHSHIGMLFADDVANEVACFLRTGAFRRPAA